MVKFQNVYPVAVPAVDVFVNATVLPIFFMSPYLVAPRYKLICDVPIVEVFIAVDDRLITEILQTLS